MKSALIFVGSPLQAISAYEAINFFKIDNYHLFVLNTGNSRHLQIECMFKQWNINSCTLPIELLTKRWMQRMIAIIGKKSKQYDYLFLGDFRDVSIKQSHIHAIKRGGKIVYLDDGNATIDLFSGFYRPQNGIRNIVSRCVINAYLWFCGISDNTYFTLYDDIPNKKYNIVSNRLENLGTYNFHCDDKIYILGTYIPVYCEYLGVSVDDFKQCFAKAVRHIKRKFSGKNVVFIPHGRGTENDAEDWCKDFDIEYYKTDKCVELYFIDNQVYPLAVYGFGSAGLFTLRKLFPSLLIYNIFVGGNKLEEVAEYQRLNDYYSRNGIELLMLSAKC